MEHATIVNFLKAAAGAHMSRVRLVHRLPRIVMSVRDDARAAWTDVGVQGAREGTGSLEKGTRLSLMPVQSRLKFGGRTVSA